MASKLAKKPTEAEEEIIQKEKEEIFSEVKDVFPTAELPQSTEVNWIARIQLHHSIFLVVEPGQIVYCQLSYNKGSYKMKGPSIKIPLESVEHLATAFSKLQGNQEFEQEVNETSEQIITLVKDNEDLYFEAKYNDR